MNKFILTYTAGITPSTDSATRLVHESLPGTVSALYVYFQQPDGFEDLAIPFTVAWWRSPEAVESLLVLIDWNVADRDLAMQMAYLAQSIVHGSDARTLLARYLGKFGYTEQHHAHVLDAARILEVLTLHGAAITHLYNTECGTSYGTMVGIDLSPTCQDWLVQSITKETK